MGRKKKNSWFVLVLTQKDLQYFAEVLANDSVPAAVEKVSTVFM